MSETVVPTAQEDEAARALAEQAGLEYREAGAVSIDPRVIEFLPAGECQRLHAVPMSGGAGSLVVGVANPSDERLAAIRELTGAGTRFVVLADRTLDALLRSRMFNGGSRTAPASEASLEQTAPATPHLPADPPAAAPPVAPALPQLDARVVDAIADAVEERIRVPLEEQLSALALSPAPAAPELGVLPAFTAGSPVFDAVAQVDGSVAAWSSLRSQLQTMSDELESARRSLREAKEQLSVAHADNDQHRLRIDALEVELATNRALVAETRLRLQEAADALGERSPSPDRASEMHL